MRREQQQKPKAQLPLQAPEREQRVIAVVMRRGDVAYQRAYELSPEAFTDVRFRAIWEAIQALSQAGKPIDETEVEQQLRRDGRWDLVGSTEWLLSLGDRAITLGSLNSDVQELQQAYSRRALLREIENAADLLRAGEGEPAAAVDTLFNQATTLLVGRDRLKDTSFQEQADAIREILTNPQRRTHGMLCGLQFNDFPGGLERGSQNIIAARPKMGKSAVMVNMAGGFADRGYSVGIISLEMSAQQIIRRMIARYAELELEYLRWNRVNEHEQMARFDQAVRRFKQAKIRIIDRRGLTIEDIRMVTRRWKAEHKLDVLFVDHLLLIKPSRYHQSMNRNQFIGDFSLQLRNMAQEFDIGSVVLTQIGRSGEKDRGDDKRPRVSDMKDSGNIEENADSVYLLYRPEYYKIEVDEKTKMSTKNVLEVELALQREGKTDTFYQFCLMNKMWIADFGPDEPLYRPTYTYEAAISAIKPPPPHSTALQGSFKPYDHTHHGEPRDTDDPMLG